MGANLVTVITNSTSGANGWSTFSGSGNTISNASDSSTAESYSNEIGVSDITATYKVTLTITLDDGGATLGAYDASGNFTAGHFKTGQTHDAVVSGTNVYYMQFKDVAHDYLWLIGTNHPVEISDVTLTCELVTNDLVGYWGLDADNSGLSAEIINNGNFDSASNWTLSGGQWSYDSSNKYMSFGSTGAEGLKQTQADLVTPIVGGVSYTLTFTVSATARYWILNASQNVEYKGTANYTAGTHTITFTAPADVSGGGISFYTYHTGGGVAHNLDNVSLKETVQAYDSTDNNNHGSLI